MDTERDRATQVETGPTYVPEILNGAKCEFKKTMGMLVSLQRKPQ